MKCPLCKAPSSVLETRHLKDDTVRRRYECFNDHRFTTMEVATRIDEERLPHGAPKRPRMKIQKIEPAREGGG